MKNNKYKISILVPIYGVEKYIERCAKSLFEQTFSNIEYIFVDDCSQDSSIQILKKIINQYPNRKDDVFIIKHAKNRGLAASRITALNNSHGDFIMHVDSDDFIDTNTVELVLKKQEENDSDIVSFGCFREYASKTIVQLPPNISSGSDMCLKLLSKKNVNVGVWGRIYRTELYRKNSIAPLEGFNMGEDFQVTPRLFYFSKKIAALQVPLYHYNCNNITAYTYRFSPKNCDQCWKAVQLNEDFFSKEDKKYMDAICIAKLVILSRDLMKCSLDSKSKDYYNNTLLKRLNSIDPQYFKYINFFFRIPLILKRKSYVSAYYSLILALKNGFNR